MKAHGYTFDSGDSWEVYCPNCDKHYEYEGVFDSGIKTECSCGCVFTIEKLWINDNEYII